jgi:peptidoglycan/LPS O-acetylase OafA/YrhL
VDYWPNGSAGVDIFFVISGLVMTLSFHRNGRRPAPAWAFMKDRIIRIVPLYWLMTTGKIVLVAALPGLATRTRLDPLYLFGSYALWPVHDWTGVIRPVLPVGWTLSYEMFFYLLVAAALAFGLGLVRVCVPVLLAVAALALVTPAGSFANTMIAEFLFGIAIGYGVPYLQRLPASGGLVIGGAALALLLVAPGGDGLVRPLTWGLPAACVVACAVACESPLRRVIPRWLRSAGDASYATYLTHGFVVPAAFIICARSISVDWAGFPVMVILTLAGSAIAGQITHLLIEQPLLLRLRTRRPVSTITAPG